jgi:hypothetical protein
VKKMIGLSTMIHFLTVFIQLVLSLTMLQLAQQYELLQGDLQARYATTCELHHAPLLRKYRSLPCLSTNVNRIDDGDEQNQNTTKQKTTTNQFCDLSVEKRSTLWATFVWWTMSLSAFIRKWGTSLRPTPAAIEHTRDFSAPRVLLTDLINNPG